MSQDAMMVFEEVRRKEIIIRHVPLAEPRELAEPQSAAHEDVTEQSLGPQSLAPQSLAPLISRLILRMEELGNQFNTAVNTATRDLIHRIDTSMEASLPANSISTSRLKMMTAENEFLGRVLEASRQINAQRQVLIDEIRNLDGPSRGTLVDEIVKTEAGVRAGETRIQQMVDDPTVDLTVVMRSNTEQIEAKAYLKGLKFQGSHQGMPPADDSAPFAV